MDREIPIEDKKSFLRNDRLLVCSMSVVYGLCILGLVVAAIWGLGRRSERLSVHATATARARATQRANATSTNVVRATEQAHYKLTDGFDTHENGWQTGPQENEDWIGSRDIVDGVYAWDIVPLKQDFFLWEDFYQEEKSEDFDIYLDTRIMEGKRGKVCSGLIFRKSFARWDNGLYTFSICNDSHFETYYRGRNGWDAIYSEYDDAIRSSDWNRLRVSVRKNRFTLYLNDRIVYKMTDNRQQTGGMAIFVQLLDQTPALIWFDNVGYQPRK